MCKNIHLFKSLLILNLLLSFLIAQEPFFPLISWGYPTDGNEYPILDEEGFDDILNANFNGALGWFKYDPNNVTVPFDSAESKGLRLINTKIYWPQAEGQYTVYEPDINSDHEYYAFPHFDTTVVVGRTVNNYDIESNGFAWKVDDNIDNAGYMVRGLKAPFNLEQRVTRPNNQYYDPLQFHADINFKMDDTTGLQASDTVLIASVVRVRPSANDYTLKEKHILFQEILDSASVFSYKKYKVNFFVGSSGSVNILENDDSLDYRVYWNGQGDLSIDNIVTEDTIFHDFSRGLFDSNIDGILNTYESYAAGNTLFRWYLRDEPHRDMFEANKMLNYYLQNNSAVRGFQSMPMKPQNLSPYMNEFVGTVDPQELVYHSYPFKVNTGTDASSLNATFDQTLALFDSVRQRADSEGIPLWLIPQMHQFYRNNEQVLRYPTNHEMRAQVYLNLCYAPDGLIYFLYATKRSVHIDSIASRSSNQDLTNFKSSHEALIATSETTNWSGNSGLVGYDSDTNKWRKVETNAANQDTLWYAVQDINKELQVISDVLTKIDFVRSFSSENVQNAGDDLIANISSSNFNPPYVHAGHMIHEDTGEDYFYLVNKRCLAAETQNVTVTFSSPGLKIEDIMAARMIEDSNYVKYTSLIANDSTFSVTLQPGEGRLFRIDSKIPSKPTGLNVTGLPGQHPLLNWNANPENDVIGHKIYRKLSGGSYIHVATVYGTTQWQDMELIVSGGFASTVRYFIKAIDVFNQESIGSASRSIKYTGSIQRILAGESIPKTYKLQSNHPNPFNPITTLRYDLPEESIVVLRIYDIRGREIKTLINGIENAGFKNVIWDSRDNNGRTVPSGMYFYTLEAISKESDKELHETMKMVLLK